MEREGTSMAQRDEIMEFLDEVLEPKKYRDYCPNGLQVYGKEQIGCLATCTSVSAEFFRQGREKNADLLLVHHGLFWEKDSRVIDPLLGKRLRLLFEADLNLVAYHLPLDAHHQLGNNAQLAACLGLQDLDFEFAAYGGSYIGCRGRLPAPLPLGQVTQELAKKIDTQPWIFDGGSGQASCLGVVSGGAGEIPILQEAVRAGCDTLVTGVLYEQSLAVAREAHLNVISLGHYNSEKLGVQALGEAVGEKFGIDVIHLDVPNPL